MAHGRLLDLSVFDWATFRTKKGAIKMHTLLDYDGKLPTYVNITQGSVGDKIRELMTSRWRKAQ